MPEFPPDFRCCHSATSSKFLYSFVERATPVGLPVQCTAPSFQFHVSFAQFTFTKSDSPNLRQPRPVPSIIAFGRDSPASAALPIAGSEIRNPTTPNTQTRNR